MVLSWRRCRSAVLLFPAINLPIFLLYCLGVEFVTIPSFDSNQPTDGGLAVILAHVVMHLYLYLLPFAAWLVDAAVWEDESQETAQSAWTVPPGDQDDFTVTLQNKQTVPVSWDGWDKPWYDKYLNGEWSNDLWVTSYDYSQAPFSQLLAGEMNFAQKCK